MGVLSTMIKVTAVLALSSIIDAATVPHNQDHSISGSSGYLSQSPLHVQRRDGPDSGPDCDCYYTMDAYGGNFNFFRNYSFFDFRNQVPPDGPNIAWTMPPHVNATNYGFRSDSIPADSKFWDQWTPSVSPESNNSMSYSPLNIFYYYDKRMSKNSFLVLRLTRDEDVLSGAAIYSTLNFTEATVRAYGRLFSKSNATASAPIKAVNTDLSEDYSAATMAFVKTGARRYLTEVVAGNEFPRLSHVPEAWVELRFDRYTQGITYWVNDEQILTNFESAHLPQRLTVGIFSSPQLDMIQVGQEAYLALEWIEIAYDPEGSDYSQNCESWCKIDYTKHVGIPELVDEPRPIESPSKPTASESSTQTQPASSSSMPVVTTTVYLVGGSQTMTETSTVTFTTVGSNMAVRRSAAPQDATITVTLDPPSMTVTTAGTSTTTSTTIQTTLTTISMTTTTTQTSTTSTVQSIVTSATSEVVSTVTPVITTIESTLTTLVSTITTEFDSPTTTTTSYSDTTTTTVGILTSTATTTTTEFFYGGLLTVTVTSTVTQSAPPPSMSTVYPPAITTTIYPPAATVTVYPENPADPENPTEPEYPAGPECGPGLHPGGLNGEQCVPYK